MYVTRIDRNFRNMHTTARRRLIVSIIIGSAATRPDVSLNTSIIWCGVWKIDTNCVGLNADLVTLRTRRYIQSQATRSRLVIRTVVGPMATEILTERTATNELAANYC